MNAHKTAIKVIEFLQQRAGFDHWWDNIEDETKSEIIDGLSMVIAKHDPEDEKKLIRSVEKVLKGY